VTTETEIWHDWIVYHLCRVSMKQAVYHDATKVEAIRKNCVTHFHPPWKVYIDWIGGKSSRWTTTRASNLLPHKTLPLGKQEGNKVKAQMCTFKSMTVPKSKYWIHNHNVLSLATIFSNPLPTEKMGTAFQNSVTIHVKKVPRGKKKDWIRNQRKLWMVLEHSNLMQ